MSEENIPAQEPEPAEGPRNNSGWVLLGIILALLCLFSVASSFKTKQPLENALTGEYRDLLEQETSLRALADKLDGMGAPKDQVSGMRKEVSNSLGDAIAGLVDKAKTDKESSQWYAAMRTEQGQDVPEPNLAPLRESKADHDHAVAELYRSGKLTRPEADALAKRIGNSTFLDKVSQVHALEKGGDTTIRGQTFTWKLAVGRLLAGIIVSGVFAGGLIVWLVFMRGRAAGKYAPEGFPLPAATEADANRMALRAAQILLTYIVLSVAVGFARVGPTAVVAVGVGILLALPTLASIRAGGKLLPLGELGLNGHRFWQNVLWGIGGFLAEFPVSMVMAVVGMLLFRFLPQPTHPAAEELLEAKNLLQVLPIILFGSITAPIWEEFTFRGLIFPGLARMTRNIPMSAIMTGLVFAMIHPQGIPLWFALATVGSMGCALTYQRRSLVPTIVMHMLHNGTIFVISLLAMGKF